MRTVIIALCWLGLPSCRAPADSQKRSGADSDPSGGQMVQQILFEKEYVNFAWGLHHDGFYIDRQGAVYCYADQPRYPIAASRQQAFFTESELMDKYNQSKVLAGRLIQVW